jgi:CRP-like cAMP-binding protein
MLFIEEFIKNPKLKEFLIERKYSSNDIIFDEGEKSNSLFIIEKGDVIIQKAINKEKTEFKDLAIISDNNILGEMGMFENSPRSARAKALSNVVAFEITKENFFEIMKNNPEISFNIFSFIVRTLSHRISHTSKELTLLYDISKTLIIETIDEKEFIKSLIDEIYLYFDNWKIEGYIYNIFNDEFEKIKELDKNLNSDIKIEEYNNSLWIDNRKYIMPLKIKEKVLAVILFISKNELTKQEINDFSTIFNTIYFIASSGIEKIYRAKDEYYYKKLKDKKRGL